MGVSIVPEMAIEKQFLCRYVRIADDQAIRTIGVVLLRGRSLTPRTPSLSLSPSRVFSGRTLLGRGVSCALGQRISGRWTQPFS
jgi:hypothetical protein